MELYLVSLSAAVFTYLLILLLFHNPSAERIEKRLSALAANMTIENIHDDVIREKKKKLSENKRFNQITRKLEDSLKISGVKLNATEYLYGWFGLTLIPVVLTIVFNRSIITVIAAGAIGFAIPPILVQRAKKAKQLLFTKQLGESLIVMSNCIKSGYSFQQAMENIATEMQPPISTEFARALREIRFGVKQEEALNHMVDRVQNKDFELLVSAVIISSQVGANLTDILDTISTLIRDRIKIRDDVRILSSQGRISGLIIGLLPVVIILLLMLVNPTYIMSFFESEIGKTMLIISVIMEVTGFLVIRKIVDIRY